jgi:DHA2 family multidrug resistance protein
MAYAYLPKDKNNAASGLMNLSRNIGGSVGISVVTTLLDRRAQVHQVFLSRHLSASNPAFRKALSGAAVAVGGGTGGSDSMHRAYATVQNMVVRQATMLAYIDNFWLLGIAILCMIPLAFLMKRARSGGEVPVH